MSQYLIDVLAEQREEAMNRLAQAEASRRVLEMEVSRLTARLAELEPQGATDGTDANG